MIKRRGVKGGEGEWEFGEGGKGGTTQRIRLRR